MNQKVLGIIGGGQLGRMLCEAAAKLKVRTIVLDPTISSPASQVADEQIVGDFKNPKKIKDLEKKVDFLTFEIESANSKVLKELENAKTKVNPSGECLEIIQDKLIQKQFLLSYEIPTAQFAQVRTEKDVEKAAEYLGYPLILKARFHGYDGRGNMLVENKRGIKKAFSKLNGKLYVEKLVPFKKELAIQVVRGMNGDIKLFPLVETIQQDGICHIVKFPANMSEKSQKEAKEIGKKVVKSLKGSGIFAIEMFLTKDEKIIVNEIAPRVHNSGHWTIEGCHTSQFEEHIRAVCNLKLASTKPKVQAAVMINILGDRNGVAKPEGLKKLEKKDGIFAHIYGKFETRKGRKMGHITAVANSLNAALAKAKWARKQVTI